MLRASSSSSFFSPLLKRTFSHSTALPGGQSTPSSQSLRSGTGLPSSSDRRAATGASDRARSYLPSSGRPRCDRTNTLRVLIERVADRRQRGANARIARDHTILHRHVQILPDQDPLVAQVRVRHPQDLHDAFDQASVVSSMRLEKPHSLSYQEHTFTSVPSMTLVSVASKIDECGSWLKSTDTSGASL